MLLIALSLQKMYIHICTGTIFFYPALSRTATPQYSAKNCHKSQKNMLTILTKPSPPIIIAILRFYKNILVCHIPWKKIFNGRPNRKKFFFAFLRIFLENEGESKGNPVNDKQTQRIKSLCCTQLLHLRVPFFFHSLLNILPGKKTMVEVKEGIIKSCKKTPSLSLLCFSPWLMVSSTFLPTESEHHQQPHHWHRRHQTYPIIRTGQMNTFFSLSKKKMEKVKKKSSTRSNNNQKKKNLLLIVYFFCLFLHAYRTVSYFFLPCPSVQALIFLGTNRYT